MIHASLIRHPRGDPALSLMEQLAEFIGNHLFLVSLFISLLMLLIWNIFGGTLSGVRQVNPAELTRLINRENALVVDLRSSDDFSGQHILHARNIPAADLESREKELEKYKTQALVVYCANGSTSARAARRLLARGFAQVYCLKGGLPSWQGANLPLTRELQPKVSIDGGTR